MRLTAFISREQSPSSPFTTLLAPHGWQVTGMSLVQIKPLSVSNVPAAEWWFFSSKNAVKHFLPGRNLPPLVRIGALGEATAAEIEKVIGRLPDFTGNGDPEGTARAFYTLAKHQNVLFPGAVNSLQSVQSLLNGKVNGTHLQVYDNTPIPDPPDMTAANALVFTSPLNARAYFAKFAFQPRQKVIAIGASTTKALQDMGIGPVFTAASPDERAMAAMVISLFTS